MTLSRRTFLAATAATAAGAAIAAGCSDDSGGSADGTSAPSTPPATDAATTTAAATTTTEPAIALPSDPFTLGVASGDPDATSVVLWTRLAPDPLNGGGMPADDVPVTWELSADESFAEVAQSGTEIASADHGHAVHAVVEPGEGAWFYRFRQGDYTSPVGRTRIAPAAGDIPDEVRFATASCQNYANGYYAAHRDLAAQQPEFVTWLGDYIYEGAGDPAVTTGRVHLGPEPTTVDEYRNRYALYKTDPNLQAAHAACPWFVIWDDHEVENNYAGLTPQDSADSAAFPARRAAAYQVWWEHQPTRLPAPDPAASEYRTYREAAWGDLLTIALLDGRQYRTDQACGDATLQLDPPCPEVTAPGRTMLGDEQEQWLYDTLDASSAVWNVIGNQVVFADATFNGAVLNFDQWDGYPEQRARILQHLADKGTQNVVVVTGDIHLAAVAELRSGDPATGTPVGVEFVTTSISSDGLIDDQLTDVLKSFPELVDAELAHRGYTLHTVSPQQWVADYRIVTDVADPDSDVTSFRTYTVDSGTDTVVAS